MLQKHSDNFLLVFIEQELVYDTDKAILIHSIGRGDEDS